MGSLGSLMRRERLACRPCSRRSSKAEANPAVSVGDRGLSYGELREAAAAVAERFDGAERVAVWAESTLETCVAVVAALATGTPLVPINPKLGRGELEHVLTDSKPDVVFGGPDGLEVDVDRPRRRAAGEHRATTRTRR